MQHLVFVIVYIKLCTKLFLFQSELNSEVTITGHSSVQRGCNVCHPWLISLILNSLVDVYKNLVLEASNKFLSRIVWRECLSEGRYLSLGTRYESCQIETAFCIQLLLLTQDFGFVRTNPITFPALPCWMWVPQKVKATSRSIVIYQQLLIC
jgi:hypothetical protein